METIKTLTTGPNLSSEQTTPEAPKVDAVVRALAELVRLKNLKMDAMELNTSGDPRATALKASMLREYEHLKGDAWYAAQRALNEYAFQRGVARG